MTETHVLVVGSGGAGLSAALAAADAGARVTLIEAADYIGGTYSYSMGIVWCPANAQMLRRGLSDSVEVAMAHVASLSGDKHSPDLLERYLRALPEVLEQLRTVHDVPYEMVPRYPDYYAERPGGKAEGRIVVSPVFDPAGLPPEWQDRLGGSPMYPTQPTTVTEIQGWGGFGNVAGWDHTLLAERNARGVRGFGAATIGYLLRAALQSGVAVRTSTSLVSLVVENGAARGATVVDGNGAAQDIACDAVILATGAFDWNDELQQHLNPYFRPPAVGAPTVDGSGMLAALDMGAAVSTVAGQILIPTYSVPGEEHNGKPLRRFFVREPSLPGGIIVNQAGRRFCDESFYRAIVNEMTRFDVVDCSYPNRRAFFVFDEEWKNSYPVGPIAAGEIPPWLTTAESAVDLAGALEISPEALRDTLDEFNKDAVDGVDRRFHRGQTLQARNHGDARFQPNPCVRPLSGRLFALEIRASTVGGSAGLRFDQDARVLNWRSQPLPGLYCAGNIAAGTVEGFWYNSGIANGRGLAFGALAGRAAVADKVRD
jgi:3-oxosteroid 1-dehydrogenase